MDTYNQGNYQGGYPQGGYGGQPYNQGNYQEPPNQGGYGGPQGNYPPQGNYQQDNYGANYQQGYPQGGQYAGQQGNYQAPAGQGNNNAYYPAYDNVRVDPNYRADGAVRLTKRARIILGIIAAGLFLVAIYLIIM